MFLPVSVCLFVCLFVDKISQKVMNGLGRNVLGGMHMGEGRTD